MKSVEGNLFNVWFSLTFLTYACWVFVAEAAANSYPSLSIIRQCKCGVATFFYFSPFYYSNPRLVCTIFPTFSLFFHFAASCFSPPKLRTVGCDVDTVAIMVWFDDLGLCNLLKFYSDFKALWDLSCLPRCERRFGLICCLCLVISIQVILLRLDGVNEVVAFTAQ